ncbi:hypothetical protein AURDEDRAFT_162781 [Auricularia subglabra TFB-10046 SS5]|nr:hypothetical protein AURDEDRAFT_162781 [Auricularia subglabra TFB-10046 SS5]
MDAGVLRVLVSRKLVFIALSKLSVLLFTSLLAPARVILQPTFNRPAGPALEIQHSR